MRKFNTLTSIPAPLDEANIDTDIIFPARFLLLMNKAGLGKFVFNERRKTSNGEADFVLNSPPFDSSEILVTGPRFSIRSRREQAVWALTDFGIRCIIAPNFGDIFYANCLKNTLLPIELSGDDHDHIMKAAKNATPVCVDLLKQVITFSDITIAFEVPPRGRNLLLSGLDETAAILANERHAIDAFESHQRKHNPWLYK